MKNLFETIQQSFKDESVEPMPDIAICSECGWKGPVSDCETDQEGDWESGYYLIHLCPKCEDGGSIDDYDMSETQLKEWKLWDKTRR